jgi:hypothetical protein
MATPDPAPHYQRETVIKPPPGRGPLSESAGIDSKLLGWIILIGIALILLGLVALGLTFIYVMIRNLLESVG